MTKNFITDKLILMSPDMVNRVDWLLARGNNKMTVALEVLENETCFEWEYNGCAIGTLKKTFRMTLMNME